MLERVGKQYLRFLAQTLSQSSSAMSESKGANYDRLKPRFSRQIRKNNERVLVSFATTMLLPTTFFLSGFSATTLSIGSLLSEWVDMKDAPASLIVKRSVLGSLFPKWSLRDDTCIDNNFSLWNSRIWMFEMWQNVCRRTGAPNDLRNSICMTTKKYSHLLL